MELVSNNQRSLNRADLSRSPHVSFSTVSRSGLARIVDAHPLGLKLEMEERLVGGSDDALESCQVQIEHSYSAPVRVRHICRADGKVLLGVDFHSQSSMDPAGLSFASEDHDWDQLSDPKELESILSDVLAKGPEVLLRWKQVGRYSEAFTVARDRDQNLVVERLGKERRRSSLVTGPIHIQFELYQCVYVFSSEVVEVMGDKAAIRPPKMLVRLLRRQTFRVSVPKEEKVVTCFDDLYRGASGNMFTVTDISEDGMLIDDPGLNVLAPVGSKLKNLKIEGLEFSVKTEGVIASARKSGTGQVVGIRLEIDSRDDRQKWHNYVLRMRYPHLSFKYGDEDHGKVWDLFERSGYVGHLDQESADDQLKVNRIASRKTWQALEESGVLNSRRLLFREADEVGGHLQMDRYYSDAWCVHHLAIDRSVSKVLAKDLYGAVTDILSTENAKFLISYHRPDLAWNQRNYYNFVENYPNPDHHDIQRFSLFDIDLSKSDELKGDNPFEFRVANKWDLKRIIRFCEREYSELVREALGLTEKDLLLNALHGSISKFGLERGRKFVVAMNGQDLVGFCRVEWGTPGINVFRLFDAIFLHTVQPASPLWVNALLERGFNVLREKNRPRALLFLSEEQVPKLPPPNYHYLCDEVRWIGNCVATRRYQAYSQTLFGKLISRRASKKRR